MLTPNAEGLGYMGGVLTLLAVLYLLGGVWNGLAGLWQALLTLIATLSLGGAAAVVGDDDPIARRLSTTLWVLAGTSATLTSWLLVREVAGLDQDAAGLAAGLVMAAGAGALWRRLRAVGLGVVCHAGLVVAAVSSAGFVGDDPVIRGLGAWLVGASWLLGGLIDAAPGGGSDPQQARLAHPVLTSAGAITLLAATQAVVWGAEAGLVLAVPTLALLIGLAVHRRSASARTWAVLGVATFVPQWAMLLPEALAWPLLTLAAGLSMIGGCVVLVRRRRREAAAEA